jgi:hypothetical protein
MDWAPPDSLHSRRTGTRELTRTPARMSCIWVDTLGSLDTLLRSFWDTLRAELGAVNGTWQVAQRISYWRRYRDFTTEDTESTEKEQGWKEVKKEGLIAETRRTQRFAEKNWLADGFEAQTQWLRSFAAKGAAQDDRRFPPSCSSDFSSPFLLIQSLLFLRVL